MFGKLKKIHMVGIGGIGMSGIAQILVRLGFQITGSDIMKTEITKELEEIGVKIWYKHNRNNIKGADVVVYSSAIPLNNPELIEARKRDIPVISRGEMLGELMRIKYSIAISGTHGKTTVTSMAAKLLEYAKLDPTVIIGGKIIETGKNIRFGNSNYLVAEADESDKSFLKLFPTVAVVTNIEPEHLEHYQGFEEVKKSYLEFIHRTPFYGIAIMCADSPAVREIFPRVERRKISYGVKEEAEIKVASIERMGWNPCFKAKVFDKIMDIELQVPGEHNIQNSLVVLALAQELDIQEDIVKKALYDFKGIKRRLEKKGEKNGIIYIDDYAHHPTEIKVSLGTIRLLFPKKRIVALFQPHRYTRTYYLHHCFGDAFSSSDCLFLTGIYSANEPPIPKVTGRWIYESVKKFGLPKDVRYIEEKEEVVKILLKELRKGDVFVTLGAGDIWKIGLKIFEKI